MRFLLILTFLIVSTSSLLGQVHLPARPTPGRPGYPVYGYPSYGSGFNNQPELITAKDQRADDRKRFNEHTASKNAMTGKTYTENEMKLKAAAEAADRSKQTKTGPKLAGPLPTPELYRPSNNSSSTGNNSYSSNSTGGPVGTPSQEKSFGQMNIPHLLTEQIGVRYSTFGETPEDGFSQLGLLKFVARKLGFTPKSNTIEDAWNMAGNRLNVPYGNFQTGDLLFFKLFSKSTQKAEIFLAMVIDGTDMAYSSFSKGKVVKAPYRTEFWKERFHGARRIPPQ